MAMSWHGIALLLAQRASAEEELLRGSSYMLHFEHQHRTGNISNLVVFILHPIEAFIALLSSNHSRSRA